MKHTWLIKNNYNQKNFFVYLFFYFYKINVLNFKYFHENMFFFKKLNFFNLIKTNNFMFEKSQKITFRVDFTYSLKNNEIFDTLNTKNNIVKNFFFYKNKINYKFLNIFFFLNSSIFSKNTNKTAFFNFFYFTEKKSQLKVIDIKKLISR